MSSVRLELRLLQGFATSLSAALGKEEGPARGLALLLR